MFGTLPTPWQIDPPWDQVLGCGFGNLRGTYVLPLSALVLQHEGTFHAE